MRRSSGSTGPRFAVFSTESRISVMGLGVFRPADWHRGRSLRCLARGVEQERFHGLLMDVFGGRGADVLLIAGAPFASVNPPPTARAVFYRLQVAAGLGAAAPRRLQELKPYLVLRERNRQQLTALDEQTCAASAKRCQCTDGTRPGRRC
jgi:hypothetical protein